MTLPLPPPTSEPLPPRRRWVWVVLLVLLAGIGALDWHIYTGQRAVRQLREAGIKVVQGQSLGDRLVSALLDKDWRPVRLAYVWEGQLRTWRMDGTKAAQLRDLDALAAALRRAVPDNLDLSGCVALQNVDGLKGLTGLRGLSLSGCGALQNVDGLTGLTGLQLLALSDCTALQNVDGLTGLTGLRGLDLIGCAALHKVDGLKGLAGLQRLNLSNCARIPAPALRELRAALPRTNIILADRTTSRYR